MRPRRTWIEPLAADDAAVAALAAACDVPAALARLLWARGHRDAERAAAFLTPRFDDLHTPTRMADMERAATRIVQAIQGGEHIVVNGDYDCDGITGTALLVSELRALGARIDFFIPDRERDGYGITSRLVERAGGVGVRVLISVDCGSSEHETIARARALGIDVIVVDHHEIPRVPAAAFAVLNPKRSDCAYPFKGLSAVGVAYKLLQAVCTRLGVGRPADGLDFVALGTLADSQPVLDENRTLVALGLARLTHAPRPGIRALRDASGVTDAVRSRQVGFRLVPRLNAVGRIARGSIAVELLLAPDARRADALAAELEAHNRTRRELEQVVTREALERAEGIARTRRPAAFVVWSETWHPGVVGISAARIVDRWEIPAAVVGIHAGVGRGSVRTPAGIDVKAALDAASDLLLKYGGHREAAGFSIAPECLPAFAARFEAAIASQSRGDAHRPLTIDAALQAGEIDAGLTTALERFEPFGTGHSEPAFLIRGLRAGARTRCVGDGHLKLELESAGGALDGIAFGWGVTLPPAEVIGRELDLVVHLRAQDPRWGTGVQLVIVDVAAAAPDAGVRA